ncbi:MAG: hypothetical protein ACTSRU_06785, partial [Candidatus Hodarchaeales archaeon]
MKRFGSTTISLVFISFLIILSLSTDFALAAQNNNISGLDSDGDGISDLVEEYYRRNISITTTSMSAVINSNWTRPASEEYNLERPFNCLFPGTSGNTVQTRISTDNGLSIDYLLGLVHIWGNLTSFNEKFRMTVRFTSIVEFKDINNNNVFDFNDNPLRIELKFIQDKALFVKAVFVVKGCRLNVHFTGKGWLYHHEEE